MTIWIAGPRMFGGQIQPGVSFGPSDFRRLFGNPRAAKVFAVCLTFALGARVDHLCKLKAGKVELA